MVPNFIRLKLGPTRLQGCAILLDMGLCCCHLPPASRLAPTLNPDLPAARFTPYLPNGVSPFQYNITTTIAVLAAAPAPGGAALIPVAGTPTAGQAVPTSQDNANAAFRGQQAALGGPMAAAPAPAPAASFQSVASSSFGGGCDCSLPTVYNAAAPDLALQLILTGACPWDTNSGCPNGTYGSGNKGGQHCYLLQQQSATAACWSHACNYSMCRGISQAFQCICQLYCLWYLHTVAASGSRPAHKLPSRISPPQLLVSISES